jgi:formylglycine-generating enzyme required for sulfatase activity
LIFWASLATSQERDPKPVKEKTTSTGLKMVRIPAGEFMMGGVESAEDLVKAFAAYKREPEFFKDEYPQHRVKITKPFYMGKCEVTVGDFKKFVEDTGYKTQAETDNGADTPKGAGGWGFNAETGKMEGRDRKFNWRNPGFEQTDDMPVLDVTWNDAVEFCKWLGKKEGKTVRLPTEAEWEYACRAGTKTRYNTGAEPESLKKNANVMDDSGRTEFPHVQEIDIPKEGKHKFTVPVGGFKPNAFGLYDMHGNVWEWCSDWHGEDYYSKSPVEDPQGPKEGKKRVRRGGAWNSFPLWARASFRNWNTPESRCVNLGFRVVMEE